MSKKWTGSESAIVDNVGSSLLEKWDIEDAREVCVY